MIIVELTCDYCVYYKGLVNSWNVGRNAFSEGLPPKFLRKDEGKCNNGIGFECVEGRAQEYKRFLASKK